MQDNGEVKLIGQNIDKVKRFSSDIVLDYQNYQKYIKPFIFGQNEELGLSNILSQEGISEGPTKDFFTPVSKNGVRLRRAKSETIANEVSDGKLKIEEVLFLSDVTAILSGIAILFKRGDGNNTYNRDGLAKFITSNDDLELIKEWCQPNENKDLIFDEKIIPEHILELIAFLEAVKKACEEYEEKNTEKLIDLTDFINFSELEKPLSEDISLNILSSWDEYKEIILPKIEEQEFKEASEKIKEKILEIISEQNNFFEKLFSGDKNKGNYKSFLEQEIVFPKQNLWRLYTKEDKDIIKIGLIDSAEYLSFREDKIIEFLERYKKELKEKYIDPLLAKKEEKKESPTEATPIDNEGQDNPEEDAEISLTITLDEIFEEIIKELIQRAISAFSGAFNIQNISPNVNKLLIDYLDVFFRTNLNINDVVNEQIKEQLSQQDLTTTDGDIKREVLQSEIYKNLLEQLFQNIDYSVYQQLSEIYEQYVGEETPEDTEEVVEDQQEDAELPSSEETPPEQAQPTERISTANVPVPEVTRPTTEIKTTGDILKKIDSKTIKNLVDKETFYAQNIVLAQLFTLHGIDRTKLPPNLLAQIEQEIREQVLRSDIISLSKATLSIRERAALMTDRTSIYGNLLNIIYAKLGKDIEAVYKQFESTEEFKKLTEEEKNLFYENRQKLNLGQPLELYTTKQFLDISFKNKIGGSDNNVIEKNIQLHAEAIYILFKDDKTVIDGISKGQLEILLGLPEFKSLTDEEFAKYKEVISTYYNLRGAELSKLQSVEHANLSIIRLSEEEKANIKTGEKSAIKSYINIIDNTKEAIKNQGPETVVGGYEAGKDAHRKSVIETLKLELIKEAELKLIENNLISQEEFNQIQLIQQSLNKSLLDLEAQLRIELINENIIAQSLRNSYEETDINKPPIKIVSDDFAKESRVEKKQPSRTTKIVNNLRKRLTKKDPKSAALNKLEQATAKIVVNALARVSDSVLPGSGIVMQTIAKAVGEKNFLTGLALLLPLLTAGFFTLGAMAFNTFLAPFLSGAKNFLGIGSSTRTLSASGSYRAGAIGTPQNQLVYRFASTTPAGANAAVASSTLLQGATVAQLGSLLSVSNIGFIAPIATIAFTAMLSIQTIFLIHSSFLIPIPGTRTHTKGGLPPGLSQCWPTTGIITNLPSFEHLTSINSKIGGIGQAYDIAQDSPQEIYSSHNGITETGFLSKDGGGWGNYVKIKSPSGYYTVYAHLSNIDPSIVNGKTTERGQFLGYTGDTGNSTGRHLHYEYSGGYIKDIVPNGDIVEVQDSVKENCSFGGVINLEDIE